MRAVDCQRRVTAGFAAGRWHQHRQVKIVQPGGAFAFEAHIVKVFVHQMKLLVNAQVQYGFGVGGIAGTGSAAVRAVTKLNDAVAALVGGARVHAVTLHQGHAGKVVRVEAMGFGQLQNFVAHIAFFIGGNKAFADGAVECFVQHFMAQRCRRAFGGLRRSGYSGGLKALQSSGCRWRRTEGHGGHLPCPAGFQVLRELA